MDCKDCYKNRICFFCVKWFGCSKPQKEQDCFECERVNCPKDKEDINE